MKKDIKAYFSLLFHYLKGHLRDVIVGVIFGIIGEICWVIFPLITRFLIDFVIIGKNHSYFKPLVLFSFLLLPVFLVTFLISDFVLVKAFKQIAAKLKLDIFKHLQYASLTFYEKEASGGITFRLLGDSDSLVDSWREILVTVPMQLVLLTSAIFMVKWNLTLAIFVFILLVIQAFIVARFRGPILNWTKKSREKGEKINGYTVGHFIRIQLIRAISAEEVEQKNFFKRLQELIKIEIKTFMISRFSDTLQWFVYNTCSFVVLFYGGLLAIHGKATVGILTGFLIFMNILYQPIATLTNLILSLERVRVNLMRVKEYLEIKGDVVEKTDAVDFVPKEGRISVENVSFSYEDKNVLSNINIEFHPNSITAIVGPTGSGKTTLAKLLVRFFDPKEGRILLDGVDIRDIKLTSLRKAVKLFLSNNYVFNGTLYENITYGSTNVSKEKIEWALKESSLDFLYKLPNGLDTIIGEEGINLSAGEAQRVALARALILSPKVFIFDEPTSSLDLETENKINNAFMKLKNISTVIIIAHRLSTAKISDKIVVLENGKIKGVGTHEDLLLENDFYKRINSILQQEK
ncbi:MAG: ABC transporter ATP-binding protein/permease [Caldisericaceae bacterium]